MKNLMVNDKYNAVIPCLTRNGKALNEVNPLNNGEAVLKARHTVLDTVSPEKSHVIIRRLRVKPAMTIAFLRLLRQPRRTKKFPSCGGVSAGRGGLIK
jgi:hypothetical protein